jgi:hypothetical protein
MHRGVKPCCAACRIVSKDKDQGPGTYNCEDCKGHGWLMSWDSCSKNSNGLEFRHLFSTGCWESSAKSKKRDRGLSASTPAKPAKEATKGQTHMDQHHQNQPKHYAIKALAETGFKNLSSDKIIDENTSDRTNQKLACNGGTHSTVPTTHGRGWQMLPHTSSSN